MSGLSKYAITGLLVVVAALGGSVALQRIHIKALVAERDLLAARVATYEARIENILEARESNAEIDNIGDLSVSPDPSWMQ